MLDMSVEGLLVHVFCPLEDFVVSHCVHEGFYRTKCALLYRIYVVLVSKVHDARVHLSDHDSNSEQNLN